MFDGPTFARGAELGFEGFDFYVAGRAGVLGDVPADVVTASLVFFASDVIRPVWDRAAAVMPRRDAATTWLACGHDWAREHFAAGPDYAELADLLGRVVRDASVALAPIFAGLRSLPEPDDPRAVVQHRAYALRELRGALHGAAILTVGLTPFEAIAVRTPQAAGLFGWSDPPAPDPFADRWALAEARTDRMFGRHLRVLDEPERDRLVELTRAVDAALT